MGNVGPLVVEVTRIVANTQQELRAVGLCGQDVGGDRRPELSDCVVDSTVPVLVVLGQRPTGLHAARVLTLAGAGVVQIEAELLVPPPSCVALGLRTED